MLRKILRTCENVGPELASCPLDSQLRHRVIG